MKCLLVRRMLCVIAVFAMAAIPSWARVAVVFRLASPPMPVEPGQSFSLCAANVGRASAALTLQFINVRTGAIVASREVILPPPWASGPQTQGSAAGMPDPCLRTTADAWISPASTLADPPLLVALVVIRKGLFSQASAATASLQVTAAGPNGQPQLLASIPLQMATLTNGRNTPIERVQ